MLEMNSVRMTPMLGELVGLVWFSAVSAALIREWRTGSLAFDGRRVARPLLA
jgi:hypothetical protein